MLIWYNVKCMQIHYGKVKVSFEVEHIYNIVTLWRTGGMEKH